MKPRDTIELARFVNDRNARTTRRADAAAHLVLVLAIAALGAWALVVYLTPCEAGALCMGAVVTPTRSGPVQRLRMALRAWKLRWQLADVEATLAHVEADLAELPEVRRYLRVRCDVLRVCLTDCEIGR